MAKVLLRLCFNVPVSSSPVALTIRCWTGLGAKSFYSCSFLMPVVQIANRQAVCCIWSTLCGYFLHEYGKNFSFKVAAHAPSKYQSNSTSGRGARASYRTMLPEISARRSLLEPSFRYLSPGREGEKCRPLDHTWQIPFVHSAGLIVGSNSYIYNSILVISCMWYVQVYRHHHAYLTIAHVLLHKHSYLCFWALRSLVFFHMVSPGAY